MKKVIPFTKTIAFKTMIAEVTDIEIKHTLSLKNSNEIEGDILVDGKYKMTEASSILEEFHYKLPFVIAVDTKYDTSNLDISIGDFYFEIINEEDLKINVDINLDGIEEKKDEKEEIIEKEEPVNILEVRNNDIEKDFLEMNELAEKVDDPLEQLEQEIKKDIKDEKKEQINKEKYEDEKQPIVKEKITKMEVKQDDKTNIGSIFSKLTVDDDTYSTYYVYVVSESDTLESIMDKYKVTRDELQDYNDLSNIKLGTKLIIPCSND